MKSEFLNILEARGFIHQATDLEGLDAHLTKNPAASAYIGFDCTAPSLHIGSLVQIMMLRHFQKCGHTPIVLMGGGTTKVGDPSGKTESRKILTHGDIEINVASIKTIFDHFLTFGDGDGQTRLVDNADWLDSLDYIPFLREVGKHFTINKMLTMESVKMRLDREQPLTFLEFNYMILQSYDFVELFKRNGCQVQLGGSDQWGNIVNGIDLIRRMEGGEAYGLTSPLITTSDGEKMGKTAKGAVWLTPEHLSDYDYWQFWRNAQDADVGKFLKLFTDLPLDEIAKLEALEGQELNEAKHKLANEATALCRGLKAAQEAEKSAIKVFMEGGAGRELFTKELEKSNFEEGVPVIILFILARLRPSKKQVRQLIQQGGARVNNEVITDENLIVDASYLSKEGLIKLSAGKKSHALIKAV